MGYMQIDRERSCVFLPEGGWWYVFFTGRWCVRVFLTGRWYVFSPEGGIYFHRNVVCIFTVRWCVPFFLTGRWSVSLPESGVYIFTGRWCVFSPEGDVYFSPEGGVYFYRKVVCFFTGRWCIFSLNIKLREALCSINVHKIRSACK